MGPSKLIIYVTWGWMKLGGVCNFFSHWRGVVKKLHAPFQWEKKLHTLSPSFTRFACHLNNERFRSLLKLACNWPYCILFQRAYDRAVGINTNSPTPEETKLSKVNFYSEQKSKNSSSSKVQNNKILKLKNNRNNKPETRDGSYKIRIPNTQWIGLDKLKYSPYSKNSRLKLHNIVEENVRLKRDLPAEKGLQLQATGHSTISPVSSVLDAKQNQHIRELPSSRSRIISAPTSTQSAINHVHNATHFVTKVTSSSKVQPNNATIFRSSAYRGLKTNFR